MQSFRNYINEKSKSYNSVEDAMADLKSSKAFDKADLEDIGKSAKQNKGVSSYVSDAKDDFERGQRVVAQFMYKQSESPEQAQKVMKSKMKYR